MKSKCSYCGLEYEGEGTMCDLCTAFVANDTVALLDASIKEYKKKAELISDSDPLFAALRESCKSDPIEQQKTAMNSLGAFLFYISSLDYPFIKVLHHVTVETRKMNQETEDAS